MESKVNSYKLTQKNTTYILTTSVQGNEVKLTIKNTTYSSSVFTHTYTVDTWKRIGSIFESIQTPADVIQWIDKTLKVHKVKVIEEGGLVKLVFFIKENGIRHRVEIPISQGGQISPIQTSVDSSTLTSIATVDTQNITAQTEYQTQSQEYTPQEYTATQYQTQSQDYLQQAATTTTTTTTTTNTEVNFSQEFGLDPSKIVSQTPNPNTQEIIKSIQDEQKLRLSQVGRIIEGSSETQDNTQFQTQDYQIQAETINTSTENNFDLNQFTVTNTTDVIPDSTAQYTTNVGEEQNIITTQDTTQYSTTDAIPDVSAQYTTTANLDQQNLITTQDTSETQFNFEEYKATTTPEITTQYTETNAQYTNVVDSAPISSTFDSTPFITPADEITTTTTNMEIKTETTPVDINLENYTQNYNNEINYGEYQGTTTTTTTTNTQFDTTQFANSEFTGYETNVQDDRLIKLEGDTNSLKNEHQQIQNKLTSLMNQVTSYKSQLEFLEKEKNSNELNALRAENASIKQQLSELNNLRRQAAEVQMLRNQISQMDPLRRKAQELDSLKGQLNELNILKAKVAELSSMQSQLGELNNLTAQVGQMNLMKQQIDELNMLRAKVDELNKAKMAEGAQNEEKETLKRKLQELENLKMQYEQEIRTLREKNVTTTTQVQESSGLTQKQMLFEEKAQQISVKGDIIHTTTELELITRSINKSHKKITLNLLYKATVDGDKAEVFHKKCDQAGSSLVLVETDKGKRFGGFTTLSWAGNCIDKKDEDAFVFSLDKMMVYENIPEENAIGCYPKFGPIFLGCQIRIYDNAFTKGGTTFEKGLNYNTQEDYELNGGERIFGIKEIEVYEVIAQ